MLTFKKFRLSDHRVDAASSPRFLAFDERGGDAASTKEQTYFPPEMMVLRIPLLTVSAGCI